MITVLGLVAAAVLGFLLGVAVTVKRDGDAYMAACFQSFRRSTMAESAFLAAVSLEIRSARKKHPGNAHLLVALMEEVGELAKAHLDNEGPVRIWAEAKQVACVASRIALEGDGDFIPVAQEPEDKGPLPNMDDGDSSWSDPPSRARVGGAL